MAGRHARAILPASAPGEGQLVQICINRAWIPVIMTALARLEWKASWQEDTDIDRAEQSILSLYSILRNSTKNCDDPMNDSCCNNLLFELRQIKALLTRMDRRQALEDAPTIVNEYNTYWNNPATDITEDYPDAPDVTLEQKTGDTPQQAARRVDSVCYLARVIVDTAYEAYRRQKDDQSFLVNIALSVVGLFLNVALAIAKRTGWGLILTLMLGLGQVSQTTEDELTQEDLEDEEVKQRIRCKLRAALRVASPTASSIKAAVAGMATGTDAREIRMTNAVKEIIANTDNVALQNSIRATLSDAMNPVNTIPACDCGDTWQYVFDFTIADYGFVSRQAGGSVRTSQGWTSSGTVYGNGTTKEVGAKRTINPQTSVITEITLEWTQTTAKDFWTWQLGYGSQFVDLPGGTGNRTYTWPVTITESGELYFFIHYPASAANDANRVVRLTLRGTGPNPFI